MIEKKLKPISALDCCMEYPALPDIDKIRRDLYNCARGDCGMCSKIRSKINKQTEAGGCRHDLLDEVNELLLYLQIMERK